MELEGDREIPFLDVCIKRILEDPGAVSEGGKKSKRARKKIRAKKSQKAKKRGSSSCSNFLARLDFLSVPALKFFDSKWLFERHY